MKNTLIVKVTDGLKVAFFEGEAKLGNLDAAYEARYVECKCPEYECVCHTKTNKNQFSNWETAEDASYQVQ